MASLNFLISDVELRLTKGKPSDDMNLERTQIKYWLENAREVVVKQAIMQGDGNDARLYFVREPLNFTVTEKDVKLGRYFFHLANKPMQLPKDKGIWRVSTDNGDLLLRGDYETNDMLFNLPFSKPRANKMRWYREHGTKMLIEGITEAQSSLPLTFEVIYIPNDLTVLDHDDEFVLDENMREAILQAAFETGAQQLQMPQDLSNDGVDNPQ